MLASLADLPRVIPPFLDTDCVRCSLSVPEACFTKSYAIFLLRQAQGAEFRIAESERRVKEVLRSSTRQKELHAKEVCLLLLSRCSIGAIGLAWRGHRLCCTRHPTALLFLGIMHKLPGHSFTLKNNRTTA